MVTAAAAAAEARRRPVQERVVYGQRLDVLAMLEVSVNSRLQPAASAEATIKES